MGISVAPAPAPDRVLDRAGASTSVASRATTVLLVLSVLLALVAGAGAAAGYRGAVILTGSMEPALSPGDLVVVRRMPAADIRAGQIVSFRDDKHGVTITHRVTAVRPAAHGARLAVTTQGDANNAAEHWTTTPEATVGRVVATLPHVGRVTNWTGSPTGRVLVLGIIGVLVAGLALRKIWSS